jgi:hypothetical protein
VTVLGLHEGEQPDGIAAFVEQTGVTFEIAESRGTLWQFAFPPGVGYPYPRDVVVDHELRIRAVRNSFDVDEVDALVQQILLERDGPPVP